MGLSKVHFKTNLHIFPYLETEVCNDVIDFFFLNNFCKEKKILSYLNRDDCEFLIFTNLLIIF
jgi:hypothetical protein